MSWVSSPKVLSARSTTPSLETVFDIVNQGLTVTIAGLTINNGRGGGGAGGGGGILNASSTLNVVNDILSNNQADTRGGGVARSDQCPQIRRIDYLAETDFL